MSKLKWTLVIFFVLVGYAAFGIGFYHTGYNNGYSHGYSQGYSDTPINVLELDGVEINCEDGVYTFTVTSGNKTISVASLSQGHTWSTCDRYEYLQNIELPSDYPEDCTLPASSSVKFPDGLIITVDYSNTERYKSQCNNFVYYDNEE